MDILCVEIHDLWKKIRRLLVQQSDKIIRNMKQFLETKTY